MFAAKISIENVRSLGRLAKLGANLQPMLMAAGEKAALKYESEQTDLYPPERTPPTYTVQRKDGSSVTRQRRKYERTGTLGRTLTTRTDATRDSVTVTVGSNLIYAPYVIGNPNEKPGQARVHKGTWVILAKHVDSKLELIKRAFNKELRAQLDTYLKR